MRKGTHLRIDDKVSKDEETNSIKMGRVTHRKAFFVFRVLLNSAEKSYIFTKYFIISTLFNIVQYHTTVASTYLLSDLSNF